MCRRGDPRQRERTARITLESSTIGGLAIDRAVLDGDYRDRSGEIRQPRRCRRDLNAKANGTLTLKDTGESNLAFEADSPSLEETRQARQRPRDRPRQDRSVR